VPVLYSFVIDNEGQERKKYDYSDMMTPYDKFISLTSPKQYLKADITLAQLNAFSKKMNDNEAAEQLTTARDTLFKQLHERYDLRA
jgi:mannitol/fructose-specific phosphotransferase system IIA component (Ntr-type)